ncbi:PREDICTED: uncharacterized protein LOC104754673 [Camelina sativa]|uniref:Uncharacterized protein LOC104754673 n=1 Tax=Camelina sativa TaxID=90675 RepID=A0ABM0WRQ6_CAMSA|nr:PREDICTED: uncharacterized protein LOC104754673 [Camelina sativa]
MDGETQEFFVSFVYAANAAEERKMLWEDLKAHQDSPMFRNKPWMVVGDFNEILKLEEHSLHEVHSVVMPGMRDFQELVQYCSLADMPFHGPLYTWCNKRDNGLICKKLDRVLVNAAWTTEYQQSYSVFEAGGCSDHLRCRIKIGADTIRPHKPFKFTNAVIHDTRFLPLVKEVWGATEPLYPSTSALYRFSKKLKALKPHLKQFSKDSLGDLVKKAKEAYTQLCKAQMATL